MKLSVQPIIYVFLGLVVSAVHAVPVVVHTSGGTTLETRSPPKDKITISFHNPAPVRGTGTPVPKLRTEIKTILKKWRESNGVSRKFEGLRYPTEVLGHVYKGETPLLELTYELRGVVYTI
ncbi:hypothetical protein C8R41DRAFT_862831 [Lentinula lateritia]|uniref:Uncharacterized protein n=1 Tax=Lentinula lateritia TaxID=40482 RepID=A0ABQ8VWC8_9AGAR|nr:hypothetical protein C8R41DRAFT_862831 [Lentinula lateritia]